MPGITVRLDKPGVCDLRIEPGTLVDQVVWALRFYVPVGYHFHRAGRLDGATVLTFTARDPRWPHP